MIRYLLNATLDIMAAVFVRAGETVANPRSERAAEDDASAWWIGGTDCEDDPHPERVRDL